MNNKPHKQVWKHKIIPTIKEIQKGKQNFIGIGQWEPIVSIATRAGIFYLPVPERKKGAGTIPRCYFFISQDSFEKQHYNIGCIDYKNNDLRIVLGKRNVSLLPQNFKALMTECIDHEGWLEKYVQSDYQTAADILVSIKFNYIKEYNVIL